MTKHQKRLSVPKSWPVERKTDTFTVKAGAGPHGEAGVPLLVVLRDVLGYVDDRKEARYALDQDTVLVNGDPVSDETRPIGMFDIVAFTERGEYFRVFPDEGGRLALSSIDEDAAGSKLNKIEDKHHVPGGDVQLNFHDGTNMLLSAEEAAEYGTGDSLIVGNDDGSIVAHFTYEEGALVTAVSGQHAGDIGRIETIQVTPGSGDNNVIVEPVGPDGEPVEGDGFETVEDYVVVIDENFIDADAVEEAAEDAAEAADTADEVVEGGDD
ncbi:30S ribosomal protein S4e [Halobacteriales archaeon QS_1_68_20]|nr:MAG: 30S ribosomal protein S4e [Halobacteriales archaeon QS_1_68_20]